MQTWTNTSVKEFAGRLDPIAVVVARAQAVVMDALQAGWKGPPFDPFELASLLEIKSTATEGIAEARVVPRGARFEIEFNPNRPRRRVRFSVAHEIAHTLFPDCAQVARNRRDNHGESGDSWQLELLCNLAASEFLMPTGAEINAQAQPTVEMVIDLQSRFDVSTEAVAIRLAHATAAPCTVVVGARLDDTDASKGFRVDYSVSSRSSTLVVPRGSVVRGLVFGQCTAVGYTAKGVERAVGDLAPLDLECIGIPPYPGMTYPRVLGIARATTSGTGRSSEIVMLRGDALEFKGEGTRILAHVVNDKTSNWGGDFARSLSARYPTVQSGFRLWSSASSRNLSLGKVHIADLKGGRLVASMVAQHGYGPSPSPRLRYAALRDCLKIVCGAAKEREAEVQMPLIGTGMGGGNWSFIRELVDESLVRNGVRVTVFTLPGKAATSRRVLGGTTLRLDEAFAEQRGG